MNRADVLIVGGGLAGAVTAEEYRKAGGSGSVVLVTQEADRPVHRPPLSKEYLRGDAARDSVFVHPAGFYDENGIRVHSRTRVESVELASRQVLTSTGETHAFTTLVLATGGRPRRLRVPGSDLDGVVYLRSLASCDALRDGAERARRVVIVGAGFVGIEVAATLTQRGIACTVVETASRMWSRLVPPETASVIQHWCERRGVRFLFERVVRGFEGDSHVRSVVLDGGEKVPADLALVAVGAELNTDLAERAGLPVDHGIEVDSLLRTPAEGVYALGDVAAFPDPIAGRIHLEHWDNALHQGRALGKTIAGEPTPFEHVAYFFSDIFDLSLNMVGYPSPWDATAILGAPGEAHFTTLYMRDGRVTAALMVNDDARLDSWVRAVREGHPFQAYTAASVHL